MTFLIIVFTEFLPGVSVVLLPQPWLGFRTSRLLHAWVPEADAYTTELDAKKLTLKNDITSTKTPNMNRFSIV